MCVDCIKKIKKVAAIVTGDVTYALSKWFVLPEHLYKKAHQRLAFCSNCDKSTWLQDSSYLDYLKKHNIEIIKNLDKLETLPELEKCSYAENAKLFFQLCKCWLPAKAW